MLTRWSGRPTLFAVAVMNTIIGLALGIGIAPITLGGDSSLYRHCAALLAEGHSDFCGFLYSPLMELAARPLTWMSPSVAIIGMSLVSLGILLVGVARETREQAWVDRVLAAVAVLTFAPVVYELLLGQTTVFIVAALYPVVRRQDRYVNGILLGIVLALAPKPLLLPVLLWMLVWRRMALTAAAATALVLTGIGLLALGPQQYIDWVRVLTGAGDSSIAGTFLLALHDRGNSSLWPLTPLSLLVACFVAAMTVWVIRVDSARGLIASLLAGLLLAPYTMLYAYTVLLLVVRPALALSPRSTRVLALTANLARSPATLTVWCLAAFIAYLPIARLPVARFGAVETAPQTDSPT